MCTLFDYILTKHDNTKYLELESLAKEMIEKDFKNDENIKEGMTPIELFEYIRLKYNEMNKTIDEQHEMLEKNKKTIFKLNKEMDKVNNLNERLRFRLKIHPLDKFGKRGFVSSGGANTLTPGKSDVA